MTRYLVTGATGFVGRVLVARLRGRGAFVRGLARGSVASGADETVVADLADLPPDAAVCADIDVVYHLAAKTHDTSDAAGGDAGYERTNVAGTRALMTAATRGSVRRVVFVSSVKVIDEGNDEAADEAAVPRPSTAYGRSKLRAERLVAAAAADAGLEAVCLRFPLVYGPGHRGNLQRLLALIAAGLFPPPPRDRNQRSMLHVENAVDALLLAGSHASAGGRTYIVTDDRPYSTREVYDAARLALGRRPTSLAVPPWAFGLLARVGDVGRRVTGRRVGFDSDAFHKLLGSATYDGSAIARELGYRPERELIGSLPELIGGRELDPR